MKDERCKIKNEYINKNVIKKVNVMKNEYINKNEIK